MIHRVKRLLANILSMDSEDISPKMALTRGNGVDPMDLASLIIACEREFKITIHDEDVLTFGCVADLARHIDQMLEEGLNDTPELTDDDRTAWFYE